MDPRRFVELYHTETEEHLRLLQRSLLALESDSAAAALAEAFRAAHTIKGMSAAMGAGDVAQQAHELEDRLSSLRAAGAVPSAEEVDGLLGAADALAAAIAASAPDPYAAGAGPAVETATPPPGRVAAAVDGSAAAAAGPAPEGTAFIAALRLHEDTALKAARALLITRSLGAQFDVRGTDPDSFDEGFDGEFRIFLGAGVDPDAAAAVARAAGDVAAVTVAPAAPRRSAAPSPEPGQRALSSPPAQSAQALRVDPARVDALAESVAELTALCMRLGPDRELPPHVADTAQRLQVVASALQQDVLALRMVAVRDVFDRLRRVVRDAARTAGREVRLEVSGDDVELDRTILDEIGEPLVHLLRNAVDHGIEPPQRRAEAGKERSGLIRIEAIRERGTVRISVSDDGAGVNIERLLERARAAGIDTAGPETVPDGDEVLRLLSMSGLSTAEGVSELSGRGVGMDVVVNRIRALGGAITLRTERGAGSTFELRLPITLALAQALHVRVGGEDYAIPLTHVAEAVDLDVAETADSVVVREQAVPLVRLRRVLQVAGASRERAAVVTESGGRRAALAVDELVAREQIVVRSFDAAAGVLPCFSGVTVTADGRPVLVLDPLSML